MKTCEGCCGDTFEVSIDEPCPTPACSACDEAEGSDTKSSTVQLTQSLLIGGIVIVVLILIFSRSKGTDEEVFNPDLNDHENWL